MKNMMFSIQDRKAVQYGIPFISMNEGVAQRLVADMLAEGKNIWCRHPEDFDLFAVGTFDDETGLPEAFDVPKLITGLSALMPPVVE